MQISISKERLTELKDWFIKYVHTFKSKEPKIQHILDLKEKHTMRVCNEILNIGKQLSLNNNELRLAEIIALLHDVGRFEQYIRYRTFMDRNSENHAELSIQILVEFSVLESFENNIKDIILRAVRYHNRASLPSIISETCLFYAKLIRDADKLDIWKVVTDYYYRNDPKKNRAIELDLPDTPGFSEEVLQDLINKKIVDMKHIKNLNDFKLLQAGWVFDINFQPTLDCIKKRHYLEMIRGVLPESKKIDNIFDLISRFAL